jgi:CRISPR-associated protein Csy2
MKRILLLPHIKVLNANALSSPYTIGFPAMTAWLGAAHALQRKLQTKGFDDLHFKSIAPVCHNFELQTYKGNNDYVYLIIGTGNPLDKSGNRPSFIEEARCHLDVSLVIEYSGVDQDDMDEFIAVLEQTLPTLKLASGDIFGFEQPQSAKIHDEKTHRRLIRRIMPGYCLIERRDLMRQVMEEGQDAIDAMLGYLQINHLSEEDNDGNITWYANRKEKGWIVPIAIGFHGISELGKAEQQRDPNTPHRFAESVVTLGEFVMPYRIDDLDNILWHYHTDLENNLYLCQHNEPIIQH